MNCQPTEDMIKVPQDRFWWPQNVGNKENIIMHFKFDVLAFKKQAT